MRVSLCARVKNTGPENLALELQCHERHLTSSGSCQGAGGGYGPLKLADVVMTLEGLSNVERDLVDGCGGGDE